MARTGYGNPSRPKRKRQRIQKSSRSVHEINSRYDYYKYNRNRNIRNDICGSDDKQRICEEDRRMGENDSGRIDRENSNDTDGNPNSSPKTKVPDLYPEREEAIIYTVSPRPSLVEAIKCKCCECNANYDDGRYDCKIRHCPLYARMPYRRLFPDYSWVFGKFSRTHSIKCQASNITPEEYLELCLEYFLTKKLSPLIKRISLTQMIRAKCYDCCSNYVVGVGVKGRVECGLQNCSLYYWTPYRQENPSYNWMFDVPYTRKHRLAINALRMPRNEYIRRVLVEGERL